MRKTNEASSLVSFGSFTIEEAEQHAQEKASARGGKWLRLPEGKTQIRWIPPALGAKWCRVVYTHMVDTPTVKRVGFVCPRMEAKKPCPICDEAKRLSATNKERDRKKAKTLFPRRRLRANVIVRGKEHEGSKIFEFGPKIEDQLIMIRSDADFGGDFVHPIDGVDLIIIRTGMELATDYQVAVAKRGSPTLHEDVTVMNDLIKNQHNLEDTVEVLTPEEIAAKLQGEDIEERRERAQAKPRTRRLEHDMDVELVEEEDY